MLMRNFLLSLFAIFTIAAFSSCTDLNDDDTIFEIQATDKKDATNPNNNGGEEPDNEEE